MDLKFFRYKQSSFFIKKKINFNFGKKIKRDNKISATTKFYPPDFVM